MNQNPPSPEYTETISQIMKTYRSLPPRPSIEQVEAAMSVLNTLNTEKAQKLEEISARNCPQDVPPELFYVHQEVQRAMVEFRCLEQSREALHLVEVDRVYDKFDELIVRACSCVSGGDKVGKEGSLGDPGGKEMSYSEYKTLVSDGPDDPGDKTEQKIVTKVDVGQIKDDGFMGTAKSSLSGVVNFTPGEAGTEKLSLIKVASLIETTARSGELILDLQGKLMDSVEWLPVSLGKLSNISELNLSENKLVALPSTINGLLALTKLDICANELINLPDTFGQLVNLTDLDLNSNRLKSLPDSFGNLTNLINLDLSSNRFTLLPDCIGKLTSLRRLNVETNELEELPYTIGSCVSLMELRLDFNQLKALPEAVGKLEHLEILTLHYNRVRKLPTTMAGLRRLRELDVSFNELEGIPESLCFAVSLEKLNVGKNFSDLRALPRSIGNLENLEELDISDDQIRELPDSFRFLSKLSVFRADETPLEVPPMQITKLGAQAVVEYMADLVTNKDVKPPKPNKKNGFWSWICLLFCD